MIAIQNLKVLKIFANVFVAYLALGGILSFCGERCFAQIEKPSPTKVDDKCRYFMEARTLAVGEYKIQDRLHFLSTAGFKNGYYCDFYDPDISKDAKFMSKLTDISERIREKLKADLTHDERLELLKNSEEEFTRVLNQDSLRRMNALEVLHNGPLNYFRRSDVKAEFKITDEQLKQMKDYVKENASLQMERELELKRNCFSPVFDKLSDKQRGRLERAIGYQLDSIAELFQHESSKDLMNMLRLSNADLEAPQAEEGPPAAYRDSALNFFYPIFFGDQDADRGITAAEEIDSKRLKMIATLPCPPVRFDDRRDQSPVMLIHYIGYMCSCAKVPFSEEQSARADEYMDYQDNFEPLVQRRMLERIEHFMIDGQRQVAREVILCSFGPVRILLCEPVAKYVDLSERERADLIEFSTQAWNKLHDDIHQSRTEWTLKFLKVLTNDQQDLLQSRTGVGIEKIAKWYGMISDEPFAHDFGFPEASKPD